MATFKVKAEHQDPSVPPTLVEAYRVQPRQEHRFRPMMHLSCGVERMPSAGDWIVSRDGQSVIVLHEDFERNYEPAN